MADLAKRLVSLLWVTTFLAVAALPWALWLGHGVSLGQRLAPPSPAHPLGTDVLGRDLLVRLAEAIRGSVLPLWAGVLAGSALGLAAAVLLLAARDRGRFHPLLRAADVAATAVGSVPVGLAAFAWAAVWQEAGLLPVTLTLSSLFAVRTYLETRDLYRQDRHLAYWTAHAALGGRALPRLWRYGVLGTWRRPLGELLGFHLRAAVAIEASLSYLGFGVQEPQASFGNMVAAHYDLVLKGQCGVVLIAAAALGWVAWVPEKILRLARLPARQRRLL